MDVGFDGAEGPAVEHFASCGNNPGSRDVHDAIGGIFERVVYSQECADGFGQAEKPDSNFRDQRERSFRADQEARQIVTWRLQGSAADLHNFALRQDHLETSDVVGRDTIGKRVWTTGIL